MGYKGALSTAFDYLTKIEISDEKSFALQPYVRTYTEAMKYRASSKGKNTDYLTRTGIFRYLWMNHNLVTQEHKNYIFRNYPNLYEIHRCIQKFRNIFDTRNIPALYLFIERYKNNKIPEFKSLAKGFLRDIDAIENAVASKLSNGFVKGTNSKFKMVKCTMYGRCRRELLCVKMMLTP